MFERMLKYFEQRPMRERRECKMQNFISFLMVLICFENFGNFSWGNFIIYQTCPFKGQLSLAGYAQSSVPGELNNMVQNLNFELYDRDIFRR